MTLRKGSGTRHVAGRRRGGASLDAVPASKRASLKSVWKWFAGVAAAALATVLVGWLGGAPGMVKDLLDGPTAPVKPILLSIKREAYGCGTRYVIPKPVGEIGVPPSRDSPTLSEEWAAWGPRLGGADAFRTQVTVVIKSRTPQPVIVTSLEPVVTSRKPPMRGTLVTNQCGGAVEARYALADLDQNPPKIVAGSEKPAIVGGNEWRASPLRFPYKVTDTETETLLLVGQTENCECMWEAKLSWSSGEASGTETIDFGGKPFHTSAISAAAAATYEGGRWVQLP